MPIGARYQVEHDDGVRRMMGRSRFRDSDQELQAACDLADEIGGKVLDLTDGWTIVYESRNRGHPLFETDRTA